MKLRAAKLADIPSLLLIEHSCFPLGIAFGGPQIRRLLRSETAFCFVAQGQGARDTQSQIAGWAVGLIRHHATGLSARIYTLAIDPDCQGQGIGKLLTDHLLKLFKRHKVRHVYLEVRTSNAKAIALYEKLGFVKVQELPGYYENGEDGIRMRLRLPC